MATAVKEELVAELNEKFKRAVSVVHSDYRGISATDVDSLRASLRGGNVEYKVVKNRLAKLAAKGTPVEALSESFTGPTSLAISYDSPTVAAKIVSAFAKDKEEFEVIGGMAEGDVFDSAGIKKIGSLPDKPQLQSMFLSALEGGPRSLVSIFNGALNQFVYLLDAAQQQRGNDPDFKGGEEMSDISTEDIKKHLNSLSVLKLVELTKELEEEWGVTAAAPVAAAAPAAGGGEAAAEKTDFDVVLVAAGDKKIQVIKAVREITGLGLKEAKDMVDGAPKTIKEKASKEEADQAKAKLDEAGATVELK